MVFHKDSKNSLNQVFSMFCVFTAYWSFTDFMFQEMDLYESAFFWMKARFLWPFTVSSLFHLVLIFTQKERFSNNQIKKCIIYAPAFIFSIMWLGIAEFSGVPIKENWWWSEQIQVISSYYYLLLIWVTFIFILSMYFIITYSFVISDKITRIKAKYIVIGSAMPMIAGYIVALLTRIFPIQSPSVASIGMGFGSCLMAYAILRYELYQLTPITASDKILSSMSDGLVLAEINGEIVFVNEPTLLMLNYNENELIGKKITNIFENENIWNELTPQIINKSKLSNFETILKSKDNENIFVSLSISVMRDPISDKVKGVVCLVREIGEQKKLEKIQRELEERKAKFISMTSHELRTPLTVLRGYTDFLSKNFHEMDEFRVENSLNIMSKNISRLERLVKEVRDSTMIEERVFEIKKKKIDLSELIFEKAQECEKMLKDQFKFQRNGLALPIHIEGDKDRLQQILDNLMDNAVRHSSKEKRQIALSATAKHHTVKISISDNGAGIAKENLERIFEKFVSIPTEFSTGSSGIGLYVSKIIAENHGGSLSVKSDGNGKGSCFTLELPRYQVGLPR
jgi:PAS domain S-box-containing protein